MTLQVATSEEYYRITLYNEFLSHVIAELNARLIDNPPHDIGLLHLLPSQCSAHTNTENIKVLKATVDFYKPHSITFPTEYWMWVSTSFEASLLIPLRPVTL